MSTITKILCAPISVPVYCLLIIYFVNPAFQASLWGEPVVITYEPHPWLCALLLVLFVQMLAWQPRHDRSANG